MNVRIAKTSETRSNSHIPTQRRRSRNGPAAHSRGRRVLAQADPEAAEQEDRQEGNGNHDPDRDGDGLLEVHGTQFLRRPVRSCRCVTIGGCLRPQASRAPGPSARRPRRTRWRPVAFALLVATVPTAIVTWAVGRNEGNHVRRTANDAVVAEAQAGRQEAEAVLARARTRALTIAHFVPVQHALAPTRPRGTRPARAPLSGLVLPRPRPGDSGPARGGGSADGRRHARKEADRDGRRRRPPFFAARGDR